VAVDSAGSVYVADRDNHTIRKITPAGVVTTFAGFAGSAGNTDGPGGSARFNTPKGLAVDQAGYIYVADWGNNSIRKISPAGIVSTVVANLTAVYGPTGIAVDNTSGYIYATSRELNTVLKIAPNGSVTASYGSNNLNGCGNVDGLNTVAQFCFPWGVAVDNEGFVYVADNGNNSIRKISPAGVVSTLAAHLSVYGPAGTAVDSSGYVYVTTEDGTVRKISPTGVVSLLAGGGCSGGVDGNGGAEFIYPGGAAVDRGGHVYVADYDTVRRSGTPTTTLQLTETESLTVKAVSGATHSVISESYMSGNAFTQLNATGPDNTLYIIFR